VIGEICAAHYQPIYQEKHQSGPPVKLADLCTLENKKNRSSDIGIEKLVKPLGNERYLLPDGSERFLVNEQTLLKYTGGFGKLYEPIKTTNVQNLRCMTTWCVQKI
jgi:hypothetical protein